MATLEDAKGRWDVAMLLHLDVQSAFDLLPHEVIEAALDCLGVICLRGFISAFLLGRCFRVRVGKVLSDPRDNTSGVQQGSVLSPFLFNVGLAGLAAAPLPADRRYPVCCAIYAADIALRVRGPRRSNAVIRGSLQKALKAVISFLGGTSFSVSPAKTEALLVHPLASARRCVKQPRIAKTTVAWKWEVVFGPNH
nr:uncharacterized protein LOC129387890 [Dermacentor andersoni]